MHKLTTAAVAGVLLVPALSSAVGGATNDGVTANYDGKTINLADGWQGAQACVVLSADDVNCYDTQADARDALKSAARRAGAADGVFSPAAGCSSPSTLVTLYAGTGFSGDSLAFVSTPGWLNLAPYGFDNQMESWVNQTACNAFVADGTNGSGDHLTLGARSNSSNVGLTWKNRASSIDVAP